MKGYSTKVSANNLVELSGELTMYTIERDWWLIESKHQLASLNTQSPISFDLSGLTRTDSAGLAWLINIVRDSKARQYQVVFKNIPDELADLAKISDAYPLLPLQ